MERDFTDVIRNKSQFEESASRKISDTRQHESYITDTQITTESALSDGRTITEKLKDYKYDTSSASSGTQCDDYDGGYKTETEIHSDAEAVSTKGVDAAGKEDMVSSNLFNDPKTAVNPTARTQSYMAMLERRGSGTSMRSTSGHADTPIKRESTTPTGKYTGETVYDTATGKYVPRPDPSARSYSFKGNQVQGAAEEPINKYARAYSTYVGGRNAATQVKNGFSKETKNVSFENSFIAAVSRKRKEKQITQSRYGAKAVTSSEKGHSHFGAVAGKGGVKVTERLKSYKMSDSQGVARPDVKKGSDGKVIRSSISSKAKGSTETKSNLSSKTKASTKETFGKKLVREDTTAGKYKSKIGKGSKVKNQHKIQNAATSSAIYKMTHDENSQNSGADAARGAVGVSYAMYSKLNRKANNANARKYAKKSGKAVSKAGSGKYTTKASQSVTRTEANKRARQLQQQRKASAKLRSAKKKEEIIENSLQNIKQVTVKVAKKTAEAVARNWKIILIAGTALVMFIAVTAGLSSCAMAFTGGTSEYVGGLAGSEDFDLTESDSYFTEKEMLLQEKIDKIEEDYPDYDEYIYDIDEIGHDALKLMAFLSAEYETYDLSKVKGLLDELFDEMYTLTLEPKTETRTRTVTKTGYNDDGTTYEYEVEEEYEWKMLYVTLKKKEWDSIIEPRFTDDKNKEMYEIYDDTDGAHQAFYNPFEQDWSSKVTSEFGWRIHPISGKEKFHNGIDIGLPTGTPIHACATGKVIQSYYSESAGNYIVIEDETGYTTHYMHLSVRNVSVGDVVKHGDIIGEVGSTGNSTGPHLHLGVKNAEGEWLNPRFMVSSFVKGE